VEDVARLRTAIEATGTQVAFVHMQSPEAADRWFVRYGLGDVPRFSDPEHRLYKAFDLQHGSLFELAHPRVWRRWLQTALGRGAAFQGKHWRQLTGVFVVDRDRVLGEIRHRNSAARPDYLAFVQRSLAGR
jgi:alkyl-hydroperoxide reductase/thiol specific antioxidant family protein